MQNNEKYVGIRLRNERTRLGYTLVNASDLIEVTSRTFSRWEGGSPMPSDKLLELEPLGFDIYYILTGGRLSSELENHPDTGKISEESSSYKNSEQENITRNPVPSSKAELGTTNELFSKNYAMIPLYDVAAAAGNGAIINSEDIIDSLAFKKSWLKNSLNASPDNLYLINIEGESMEPTLRPGDIILIDKSNSAASRDGIYVIRIDNALLVKRVQRLPGNIIKISSDNPTYEPFEVNAADKHEDIAIIGRVVWTGRRV